MAKLTLQSNTTALAQNTTLSVYASGGTGPYTFSVINGGVGGTINADGVYTASCNLGNDTIRVKDVLGAKVEITISVLTFLELACDIIRHELNLDADQVFIWNQKYTIPNDFRVYISLGQLSLKPFGASLKYNALGQKVQSINFKSMLSIDIFSRSINAALIKEHLLMALSSQYSESQQEANCFYIAKLPSAFNNISELDGAAIPYRYNFTIATQYMMIKQVDNLYYFDVFAQPTIVTEG